MLKLQGMPSSLWWSAPRHSLFVLQEIVDVPLPTKYYSIKDDYGFSVERLSWFPYMTTNRILAYLVRSHMVIGLCL